ncbi:MAG: nucleoside-diphosphate kinase [Chitinophagaceae bacterium]|nr:nucleoside-diphosphate kinase [Chitinophagaceae bacterium]
MTGTLTFTMIKPDAVAAGNAGAILQQIEGTGFEIVALKMIRLSAEQAAQFYDIHTGKPFYDFLVNFMSSGKIIAAVLKKNNAVQDFRTLIGNTNPAKAEEGTIRKLYASSMELNAIHGSDSDENALIEANFFFSNFERY